MRGYPLLIIFCLIIPVCAGSSEFVRNESTSFRSGLALTVVELLPDDALRSRFLGYDYLIAEYARAPAEWNDTSSHFNHLLDNVLYLHKALIDAMNRNNWTLIAMMYGVLAHYVGDCADPFNVVGVNDSNINQSVVYELFIDVWAGELFDRILDKYRGRVEEKDNITRAVEELIDYSRKKYGGVIDAVDRNDTAMLLSIVDSLASRAVVVLYSVLMNAIKNSELAKSHRVLGRWHIVAIAMIGLSVLIIVGMEIRKRRSVRI